MFFKISKKDKNYEVNSESVKMSFEYFIPDPDGSLYKAKGVVFYEEKRLEKINILKNKISRLKQQRDTAYAYYEDGFISNIIPYHIVADFEGNRKELREEYKEASPDEKIDMLSGWIDSYEKEASELLKELVSPSIKKTFEAKSFLFEFYEKNENSWFLLSKFHLDIFELSDVDFEKNGDAFNLSLEAENISAYAENYALKTLSTLLGKNEVFYF